MPRTRTPPRLEYAHDRKSGRVRVRRSVRVRRLGRLREFVVYLVNGEILRREIDADYTMGGNPARYGYVPIREIWIDRDLSPADAMATILHEFVEFNGMYCNGEDYDTAHGEASRLEQRFRERLAKKPPKRISLALVERELR